MMGPPASVPALLKKRHHGRWHAQRRPRAVSYPATTKPDDIITTVPESRLIVGRHCCGDRPKNGAVYRHSVAILAALPGSTTKPDDIITTVPEARLIVARPFTGGMMIHMWNRVPAGRTNRRARVVALRAYLRHAGPWAPAGTASQLAAYLQPCLRQCLPPATSRAVDPGRNLYRRRSTPPANAPEGHDNTAPGKRGSASPGVVPARKKGGRQPGRRDE
jgi:hypothetical protein